LRSAVKTGAKSGLAALPVVAGIFFFAGFAAGITAAV
jgi:hypothetical protein